MSVLTRSRWVKRLGIGTLALLGIGVVSLQSTPADARVFIGLGGPVYGYAPPPYYPYAYPAYYGYGYPYYGGGFVRFGGHHHHWR
jgi:hypothetical protein